MPNQQTQVSTHDGTAVAATSVTVGWRASSPFLGPPTSEEGVRCVVSLSSAWQTASVALTPKATLEDSSVQVRQIIFECSCGRIFVSRLVYLHDGDPPVLSFCLSQSLRSAEPACTGQPRLSVCSAPVSRRSERRWGSWLSARRHFQHNHIGQVEEACAEEADIRLGHGGITTGDRKAVEAWRRHVWRSGESTALNNFDHSAYLPNNRW